MDLFMKTPCVSVVDDQRGAWLAVRGCIEGSGAQVQTVEIKYQAATGERNGSLDLAFIDIEMPESMAFKLSVSCRSYVPAGLLPW